MKTISLYSLYLLKTAFSQPELLLHGFLHQKEGNLDLVRSPLFRTEQGGVKHCE